MKIYFARHGQTDWNTLRKVQGTTDIPLNENGIAQAHLLCKNLLIISHGAVIMTLLAMKRNIPFEQSHTIEVDNASPIEFSIEELNKIRERL